MVVLIINHTQRRCRQGSTESSGKFWKIHFKKSVLYLKSCTMSNLKLNPEGIYDITGSLKFGLSKLFLTLIYLAWVRATLFTCTLDHTWLCAYYY